MFAGTYYPKPPAPSVTGQETTGHQLPSIVTSSSGSSNTSKSNSQSLVASSNGTESQCLVASTESQCLVASTESQCLLANTDSQCPVASTDSQCPVASTESQHLVASTDSEPETASELELDDVIRQQKALLVSLQQAPSRTPFSSHAQSCYNVYYAGKSAEELKKLQAVASELESSLKEISTANQMERKRLASAHSTLCRQSQQSRGGERGSNDSLRRQLMSLASRQKTLLQCFKTQRDVAERLARATVLKPQERRENPLCRSGDSRKIIRQSAAIPNLVQHLKPQDSGLDKASKSSVQQPVLCPPIDKSVKTVPTQQPPTASTTTASTSTGGRSQAVLAVPVPLQTLIQHQFIQPGTNCLSCVLMVRERERERE